MSEPKDDNPEPLDAERLMDHEYDGIREYDNPLPGWWKNVFLASFLFSIGYLFHYHVSGNGKSVEQAYALDVRQAREQQALRATGGEVDENALAKLMADAALMSDARSLFAERCQVCHGDQGQGLIGPNLTDKFWIHGQGKLMDVYEVVTDGVPQKGMPAWERQLAPVQLRVVTAFVGTLRGKNLPGKPPEGTEVAAR
jgi:cytochrome c oxidase cbb3-type subunit 3